MTFNSFPFLCFFLIFYVAYLLLQKKHRAQNALLLAASYFFYGWWDWKFLLLLILTTVIVFILGLQIGATQDSRRKKLLLIASIISNLAILGFFKYFNFFSLNFARISDFIGLPTSDVTLNIVLPLGISFYTFQALSYTIDVYRGQLAPARNFLDLAVYVALFPQLVAGPIERADSLLPQVQSPRIIQSKAVNSGLYLLLWGYFKKVVVADNLGAIASPIFETYTDYTGLSLLIGVLAFSGQIYCDFSGYSDIARGLAKLMGFELMINFKLPYFAINPSDFWSRWHISLSSWLRDYLYIPLGGNRQGQLITYRNLFLTMLLGGLWHGAAWNFIVWGAFQGILLILYRIFDRQPEHLNPWGGQYAYPRVLAKMFLMFILTNIGWIIFRSNSVEQIAYMLTHINFQITDSTQSLFEDFFFYSFPLLVIQIYQYISRDLLVLTKLKFAPRTLAYSFLLTWVFIFGFRESTEFIYFQF